MVWAASWYNKGAYSVTASSAEQIALYIGPLLIPLFRSYQENVNHVVYIFFFALLVPLEWFCYSEKSEHGWIYLILQIPLIWLFCLYAIFSLAKIKRMKSKT